MKNKDISNFEDYFIIGLLVLCGTIVIIGTILAEL